MKFEVGKFLKYGFFTAVLVLSTDVFYMLYERQQKRIASRPVHEVTFIMSDGLRCCDFRANIKTLDKCQNKHCKGKLVHKIIQHINSANHLICIAMYMMTMKQIGDALLNAQKRGVTVRVISNHSMTHSSGSQINRLQEEGLAVRIAGDDKDRQMHNKFCLIDVVTNETKFQENTHPANGILITGSLNWTLNVRNAHTLTQNANTFNGFDKNWENVIITSDEHLKSQFKEAFDSIWCQHA